MALPLGKKSLVQIERRCDPVRRVVDLATLLEWLLRLQPLKCSVGGTPPLLDILDGSSVELPDLKGLSEAVGIRDRLVHPVPGNNPPKPAEVEKASRIFHATIVALLKTRHDSDDTLRELSWQAANDPLGELKKGGPPTDPRERFLTALWRLDLVTGRRVPFTQDQAAGLPVGPRLARLAAFLTDVLPNEVEDALAGGPYAESTLRQAAGNLEAALDSVLAFDATWRLAPGVIPLPAIRLEPDMATRVRLLTSLVEHQLAWIAPRIESNTASELLRAEAGTLFLALIDRKGHLLPDPEELRLALGVRNRLVRFVPDRPPLLVAEVEQAEITLWQAAYELRRHCHLEHADALSAYPQAPLRTQPASQIRSMRNPLARLSAWMQRLEALATLWEGTHPGRWAPASPTGGSIPAAILARHPESREGSPWNDLWDACCCLTRVLSRGRDAAVESRRPEALAAEQLVSQIVAWLEKELKWVDLPRRESLTPAPEKPKKLPASAATSTPTARSSPTTTSTPTPPAKPVPARGFIGWLWDLVLGRGGR